MQSNVLKNQIQQIEIASERVYAQFSRDMTEWDMCHAVRYFDLAAVLRNPDLTQLGQFFIRKQLDAVGSVMKTL